MYRTEINDISGKKIRKKGGKDEPTLETETAEEI